MSLKRPSFLPSLDELENQALKRSAAPAEAGSQFDHPTAKKLFWAVGILTVIAHVVGGVIFFFLGF
ncbi:hypothetical protein AB0J52_07980 [Spirillospora sp. NPDC049652]|uniref:hypothetical protein n=1 Tax=Actinomadura oligospora TaxID=111804 RepID=UPI00047DCE0C|nr:hypothetical protein [Actinomadura oligospora]